jgi:hypothetical protein
MTEERRNEFLGDDTMYLFTTNADYNTHNMNQIQKINEKICLIQADQNSKNRSTMIALVVKIDLQKAPEN